MQLITPCITYQESYLAYIKELGSEERYPFPLDFDHRNFRKLLNQLNDFSRGIDLPEGYVPSSTLWLIVDNEIAGVCNIRHYLNDSIRACGGHIGLGIRPTFRGKGLGSKLMDLAIHELQKMGVQNIHIHCYKENNSSAAIIKKNGGLMDSEIVIEGKVVQRFLVQL